MGRIRIVSTTNWKFDEGAVHLVAAPDIDAPELAALRDYVAPFLGPDPVAEPDLFYRVMAWVRSRWDHDGMNEARESDTSLRILKNAAAGVRYRCVEYGKVTRDILLALGHPARMVSLKSPDAAYGGYGMGHVASEVWSDARNGWIFLDPQFSVFAMHRGAPLSFHGIYRLWKAGKFDRVAFSFAAEPAGDGRRGGARKIAVYRRFLSRYFGYLTVAHARGAERMSLCLPLEGRAQHLTFQGTPTADLCFARSARELYPALHRTLILFRFRAGRETFQDLFARLGIRTNRDYLRKMRRFAPEPDFILSFRHNMPWFDRFEVRVDGEAWRTVADPGHHEVRLSAGRHVVRARCVNRRGVAGVPSVVELDCAE